MEEYCFAFLENSFYDIAIEAKMAEKHLVNGNYIDSIIRIGKASEILTINICEFEDKDYLVSKAQKYRLNQLEYKGYIPNGIYKKLDDIRRLRNKSVHGYVKDEKENALNLHAYFYYVAVFFYKRYNDNYFSPEPYSGPKMKPEPTPTPTPSLTPSKISKSPIEGYAFKKYQGSYLLNELSKLSVSSIEAVENNNFSMFKNYLHVDRSIQHYFIEELATVSKMKTSHLIMLCGSSGDGKSHLLAYLKQENPELYNKFIIHNDATESHDPSKDSIDTLASVLEDFNDDNIEHSTKKIILGINLGILNDFLESEYAKTNFKTLKSIIDEAKLFDSKKISKNVLRLDKISFITFTDYNMFELSNDENINYASSEYFSSLFEKITQRTDKNPFYVAYLMDKKEGYLSPIIYNYEMLMDKEVQDIISSNLIKLFIKYRKIVSTRDILNFIYEIIVPPEYVKIEDLDNINDFIDYLLPNLLFNSPERSPILELINNFDPTLNRNEELDKFIVDLNLEDDIHIFLNRNFDLERMEFIKEFYEKLDSLRNYDTKTKQKISIILIRLSVFYGKGFVKNNFIDQTYLNYLKYLYAYNTQSNKDYKNLFKEVKKAIFNWKGSNKKDYIYVDELDDFKVLKNLKLKSVPEKMEDNLLEGLYLGNRFKTDIRINFSVIPNSKKIPLDIDYSLYEYIVKLSHDFKPNRADEQNLTVLEEFINTLISQNSDADLYIESLETGKEFIFTYDQDFESYEFKEV